MGKEFVKHLNDLDETWVHLVNWRSNGYVHLVKFGWIDNTTIIIMYYWRNTFLYVKIPSYNILKREIVSMNKIKRKATIVKNYLFDWLGIDWYFFFGPYPILVALYLLNIADLINHEIVKPIISEPAVANYASIFFVLTCLGPMVFRLGIRRTEIKEHFKRKTPVTKSLGLASFVGIEFASVTLGLAFGLLGLFQYYISDILIRLELILFGLSVPNLLSIMGRGYIGQSLIAKKLRLSERIATHLHAIGILAGVGFLIVGLTLFVLPDMTAQKGPLLAEDFAYAQSSSINSTSHELTLISTLPNNRIIITEQFVYAKPGKYLFVYVFPYQIRTNLTDPLQLNNNRIIDLKYVNFPDIQSSIAWVLWNSTSVGDAGFGRGGIEEGFEIDGSIYENDKGYYAINLPLATNPKRIDLTDKRLGIIQQYQPNWIWIPLKLDLVINGKATNVAYNPQVEKEQPLFHKFGILQNNRELLWTIPNEQTVSIRYDMTDEIHDYERNIFLSGLFLGVGIPMLIGSITDYVKWRRTDLIRYSGVVRIKHYIFHAWFMLFEMRLSFQSKSEAPLGEKMQFAQKLFNDNKKEIEKLFERIDSELIVIQPMLDPNFKPRITYYEDTIERLLNDFPKAVEEQREDIWYRDLNQLHENVQKFMEEPS